MKALRFLIHDFCENAFVAPDQIVDTGKGDEAREIDFGVRREARMLLDGERWRPFYICSQVQLASRFRRVRPHTDSRKTSQEAQPTVQPLYLETYVQAQLEVNKQDSAEKASQEMLRRC